MKKLPDDKDLVERLNKGDRQAFENIYWMYRRPMMALAQRYLKDQQLAEDAVQDVFSKLWDKREVLDSERSLRGFIFTSLRNHVLNLIKIQKRRILRQFEYTTLNEQESRSTDEETIYSEMKNIVEIGVGKLPEGKQLVFELKSFKGYTNQEIAERLGISVHTVRSQFYKANKVVQQFVTKYVDK